MRLALATTLVVLLSVGAVSAQSSVKADLFPGLENMHKYRINAIPSLFLGEIGERIGITMLWDTPTTNVVIFLVNVTDPTETEFVLQVFGGHDRHAYAETYLAEGTYEIWVAGVTAATHYHMNTHYFGSRTATRTNLANITGERVSAAREALNLELEAELSSKLEQVRTALAQ